MNHNYDTLYDSDTNDYLTAEDLGLSDAEYAEAIEESAEAGDTGHIRVYGSLCGQSGRRVYAQ